MMGRAVTSSSFHYQWTYDVFLNFRGEDTRYGFTGNLYYLLTQKGVRTFFDDEKIRKGDEITPTLIKAIEESRMAITVFSKNYASSISCLDELVKIHQCIKQKGRQVWPIFYDVEPSEVRYQKGNYKQALDMHKQKLNMHKQKLRADEEKMRGWKLALYEIANISGSTFNPRQHYEYQLIESIVKAISNNIHSGSLHVADHPVGLDSRLSEINTKLQVGLHDKIIMVGICGIGGIGKTTIACAMYNSIADKYEGLCFLNDLKENSRKLGLEKLQERILSKILGVDIKIEDVNEGVTIIKRLLHKKKILLILDNVDQYEQLQKLAGHCDWFGSGSRIIITTRDAHLLDRHRVEKYHTREFNEKESLELLTWNAFRNNQIELNYQDVLDRVIRYSQGLPLALEVIGTHLCGMNISAWESALDEYKRFPNETILQSLKISYDGLTEVEKEIFLDIACCYKESPLGHIIYMMEHIHGFNPLHGISVLADKCLIKIEEDCIKMHDLIQDMGKEIVRKKSPNELDKRSRLVAKAISQLEDEFKQLLSSNSQPVEPKRLFDCLPNTMRPLTGSPGLKGDSIGKDPSSNNHSESQSNNIDAFVYTLPALIPPRILPLLHDLAKQMAQAGHQHQLIKIYRDTRTNVLEESLHKLGVEKLSKDDVQKLQWEVLKAKIGNWIYFMRIVVKLLFAAERKVCDKIFEGFDLLSDQCFAEVTKNSVSMLLGFGEVIAKSKRSLEELFVLLDMYAIMQELRSEIKTQFKGKACNEIRATALGLTKQLAQTAQDIFGDFEEAVEKDATVVAVTGGTVHPLTHYVTNYVKFLFDYESTLKQLFQELLDKDDTSEQASATMRIMQAMQTNLGGKSKQYKDLALTHLFLMNNIHYIVKSVQRFEAKDLLGDDWVQRHRRIVQQHAVHYKRNAWAKILQCLSSQGLTALGGQYGVSKVIVKERFKTFNVMFEEIQQKQSQWTVPDLELRESLRLAVAEVLLPAYRSFVSRFGHLVESVNNPQKFIKYTPEDFERILLSEFFEGKQR